MTELQKKSLVLYVDDDDLVADLVQAELTSFEFLRVPDGEAALEYLNRAGSRPALVLLDLNMPKKDGFQTLSEIRATPSLAGLTIAIFTTSQNPAHRTEAFALGASHYIEKPSSLEDLASLGNMLRRMMEPNPASPDESEKHESDKKARVISKPAG